MSRDRNKENNRSISGKCEIIFFLDMARGSFVSRQAPVVGEAFLTDRAVMLFAGFADRTLGFEIGRILVRLRLLDASCSICMALACQMVVEGIRTLQGQVADVAVEA